MSLPTRALSISQTLCLSAVGPQGENYWLSAQKRGRHSTASQNYFEGLHPKRLLESARVERLMLSSQLTKSDKKHKVKGDKGGPGAPVPAWWLVNSDVRRSHSC